MIILIFNLTSRGGVSSAYLTEDGGVRVGQRMAEILRGQEARGQAVHTQTLGVQQRVRKRAHLGPVHVQHARAQLLAQQLRLGPGRRVFLHVLHEAVAFGTPRGGAVHQEAALEVAEGPHQLLELLLGEGSRQVGDAQQSVGRLQLHGNLPVPEHVLVELFDGALGLFPVEKGHKR